MLVDFTVRNFRSIKDEQTLSMVVSPGRNDSKDNIIELEGEKFNLLPSAFIYGANASGKSNVLRALEAFCSFIVKSTDQKLGELIPIYEPFKLNKESLDSPSFFEIKFIMGGVRHRYSIEFNKSEIIREELFFYPEKREAKLFSREKGVEDNDYGKYWKGERKAIEKEVKDNELFLSKAANRRESQLGEVYLYFVNMFNFHTSMDSSRQPLFKTSIDLVRRECPLFKKKVLGFLNAADFHIEDIKIERDDKRGKRLRFHDSISDIEKEKIINDFSLKPMIGHAIYDGKTKTEEIVYLELEKEESGGTIKMYDFAAKVIGALEDGSTLIVDEFDSGLHSHLSEFVIELFNNPDTNPNNSQLIVVTHDTTTMDIEGMRRDQIWFTEKNRRGETELYSLNEFDKNQVRKGTPFTKWYLDGRLGGIPSINSDKFRFAGEE